MSNYPSHRIYMHKRLLNSIKPLNSFFNILPYSMRINGRKVFINCDMHFNMDKIPNIMGPDFIQRFYPGGPFSSIFYMLHEYAVRRPAHKVVNILNTYPVACIYNTDAYQEPCYRVHEIITLTRTQNTDKCCNRYKHIV